MDPFSYATAFATIVSLIGQFRAERGATKQADFNDFLAWLVETKHENLKSLIEGNEKALDGIRELLNEHYDTFTKRLGMLDDILARLASSLPGFSGVSIGLKPKAVLSSQALSILKQLDSSGTGGASEYRHGGGRTLVYLGTKKAIEVDDFQFLEDDLKTLVDVGLLRYHRGREGEDVYSFTRAAADLVRTANS